MSHTRNTRHGGARRRPNIIDKIHDEWCIENGYKLQASSTKLRKLQAASDKPQAAGLKLQAASGKLVNLRSLIKFHVAGSKVLNHDEGILRM